MAFLTVLEAMSKQLGVCCKGKNLTQCVQLFASVHDKEITKDPHQWPPAWQSPLSWSLCVRTKGTEHWVQSRLSLEFITIISSPFVSPSHAGTQVSVQDVTSFLEEAVVMKDFDHPNVLPLLGVALAETKPYVILPYMEHGDLKSYVSSKHRVRDLDGSYDRHVLRPRKDGRHFCRWHIPMYFLEWKLMSIK